MPRHTILSSLLVGWCVCCLGGCVPATVAPLTAGLGADIAIFHRTVPDMIYSAVTGRDCSVVRLDDGQSYCKPVDPPVPPVPYCTRSLGGTVDCWAHPQQIPTLPAEVAQGPRVLTPEQNRLRLARWPTSLQ